MYCSLPEKKVLTFAHLYGDTFAVLEKAEYTYQLSRIIMPKGFQPEIGKKYNCFVRETKTGKFVYENLTYRLCIAYLEDGNPFDAIEHEFHGAGSKKPDGAKLGDLLKDIQLALPEKHELLNLRVQSDRKHGGYMFVPKYSEADEEVDGKPSMRIFKPRGKVSLKPGRTYNVRLDNVRNTGRRNIREYVILEVGVTVL
jgi:hypothetical protein